jgi:hypothetical protein
MADIMDDPVGGDETAVEYRHGVVTHVRPGETGVIGRLADAMTSMVNGEAAVPIGELSRHGIPRSTVKTGGV